MIQSFKTFYENDAYYAKLGDSTVDKRKAQFNRQTKMADDNPDAYKPAPGDATAKTKVSKWTDAYNAKYGVDENEDDLSESKLAGIEKKSEKTGIAYGILKKVFDRGMAAWKTGHRPGTTPHQWAYARINSFIVGAEGTWGRPKKNPTSGADSDLAKDAIKAGFTP